MNIIKKSEIKLFNKLFSILPTVKKVTNMENELNLKEPIKYIYHYQNKGIWFSKGETEDKYIFIFGVKNKPINKINVDDYILLIDFDKNIQYNDNNLGIFFIKNSKTHIFINRDLLNKRYSNINTENLKITTLQLLDKTSSLDVFDLGVINEDFYENIEKLLLNSENIVKNENPMKNTTLSPETTTKMNLFLKALKSGKSHKKAYEIAKINKNTVKIWYKFGAKGKKNYIPFYNEYKQFYLKNIEKMEIFLEEYENEKDFDNALEKSKLTANKVKAWYNLGKKNHENYKEFYLSCERIFPDGIPENESKNIVDNTKLMNEFITLIEDGKTNEEAIEELKIPKFKVKNWIELGKLGNKKYVDFYNAYMTHNNAEIEKKKKQYKTKNVKKTTETTHITESNRNHAKKHCKQCGRQLNKKSEKDLCKRCAKKQYASKILIKLLKSINPEVPFKKDDLKILGLEPIQIKGYIWILEDVDLITKKNNKYLLKSKDQLETFIKNSGLEIEDIESEETTVKLNKTCKKCGKTLEISKFFPSQTTNDGFEDYCKKCKKLISTANYLKEIIEFVDYDSKFSEEELKPHFNDSLRLQAKIWSLLDNDLATRNFEENHYILSDKKTCEDFLDKYYEETSENSPNSKEKYTQPEIGKNPNNYTKQDQMNIIIQAIGEGKSRKEASNIAQIPLYKITHWYNEGRQGYGSDNIDFYKQIRDLENNKNDNEKLKNKMDTILNELKTGKDISEFSNETIKDIDEWIEKGKQNKTPYNYFSTEYEKLNENNINIKEKEYENKEINRKIFFENLKIGKTKEESAKTADLPLSLIKEWYLKGYDGKNPYTEFYNKYVNIKNNFLNANIPQIEKKDKFTSATTIEKMNIILKKLSEGMNENDASNQANISFDTYKYWLNRGKQNFGEDYVQFYKFVNEIKNNSKPYSSPNNSNHYQESSPDNIPKIYSPLPKEYLETFPKKSNQTGIAWVNKIGNQFIYSRTIDNKVIKITEKNIENLYQKVLNQNQIWGVRDYKKAKEYIEIPDDFEIPDMKIENNLPNKQINIDKDIYATLPKEYLSKFNPNPTNKTGIAWVNRVGNKWIYQRQRNGKTIRISDENIHELHEKVINKNQIWGIIDINKAKPLIENEKSIIKQEPKIKTPEIHSKDVTVTYINSSKDNLTILIKGMIKSHDLLKILNELDIFERYFKRIVTTNINGNVDLFIELEITNNLVNSFEKRINKYNGRLTIKLFKTNICQNSF